MWFKLFLFKLNFDAIFCKLKIIHVTLYNTTYCEKKRTMKELLIKIPEKEYSFFMKLIKNLGFVQIEQSIEGDSKEAIIQNLKHGFEDMKQIKKGKLKTKSANDFLNEL